MNKAIFKGLLASAAVIAGFAMSTPAIAADLDCKTAKLIVPWKAGGGTILFSGSLLMRLMNPVLSHSCKL